MSFPGYAVTLFDMRKDPVDLSEIPDMFTIDYFAEQLKKRWEKSFVDIRDDQSSAFWNIPELFSGDDDYPAFSGRITDADKGISFGLALYSAITEFVFWMRSIIPPEHLIYFTYVYDFNLCLKLTPTTTEADILAFLSQ